MGIVHDGAGLDAEVVAASDAVPLAPAFDRAHVHIAAPGARNASGPSEQLQVVTALVVSIEAVKEINEVHDVSES